MRRGPLPNIAAIRLDSKTAFPEDWKPADYRVKKIESVPEEFRKEFAFEKGSAAFTLRNEIERMIRLYGPEFPEGPEHLKAAVALEKAPNDSALTALHNKVTTHWTEPKEQKRGAALVVPAWTYDRGNVKIFASPDQFADAGPLIGNDPEHEGPGWVEYDIDFPATGEYIISILNAAAEARPTEVFVDDKSYGKFCHNITYGSAPYEIPVKFSFNSSTKKDKRPRPLMQWGVPRKITVTEGKHTVKFARSGPLPNILHFHIESLAGGWKQQNRPIPNLETVPARERSALLPAGAVNIAALRMGIEHRINTLGADYPDGPTFLKRLEEFEKQKRMVYANPDTRVWECEAELPEEERTMEKKLSQLRSDALVSHPAIDFDKLLFFKRTAFTGNTYTDNKMNAVGGGIYVLSPVSPEGKVTNLIPELEGGLFTRFDLSFDAKKMVFGYKKQDEFFRIYEIDIDPEKGTMVPGSLRKLTDTDDKKTQSLIKLVDGYGPKSGNGFHFDDMDPCYMPNGKIMFSSTRSMRCVFCNPSVVTTLYVMDADGKNMRQLSGGPLSESDPCMLDDGRIVYTRWEYIDKGLGNGQSVWAVRPDGSGVDHIYKNSILRPAQMLNTRSIPGSRKLITVGSPHSGGRLGGPVILVDNRTTRHDVGAMECVTPEVAYPCGYPFRWDQGFFREPFPFSENFYLVSHKSGEKGKKRGYGIYLLDKWGNRALLHDDEKLSCYQPVPLRPRVKPVQIAEAKVKTPEEMTTATVFVQDVYRGMTGIERGRVKYIRVMGALPWPWTEKGIFRLSYHGTVHRKKVYGVADVHEDGSAFFTVPTGENLFFQALDENFMQLQHMPTFINIMPGEHRSCIGCHENRRQAPNVADARPIAMTMPVQQLQPQPGDTAARMVDYTQDIQTILDKKCISCHGAENPKADLNLTGELTNNWTLSYENLEGRGLVSVRDARFGRSGFRPQPPLNFGSHLSKLVSQIQKDPCKGNLTEEEFIKIVTWVDANCPYLGYYGGHGGSQ